MVCGSDAQVASPRATMAAFCLCTLSQDDHWGSEVPSSLRDLLGTRPVWQDLIEHNAPLV